MNASMQHDTNLIDFLSLRLFPHKLTIQAKAELLEGEKRDAAMAYIEAIDTYEADLRELSDQALHLLVEDEKESDRELEKEKAEEEENNRFFFDPSARADYLEWTQYESWTVDQATALLLGKDPEVVSWDVVNPLVYKSKFAKRYGELRKQLKAARDSGELHDSQGPAAYLHFAKSAGFALPAELEALLVPVEERRAEAASGSAAEKPEGVSEFQRLLQQNRQNLEHAKPHETDGPGHTDTFMMMRQEREILLRMLGALAVGRYALKPGSDDMAVTEAIVKDLKKGGLSVNTATAHRLIGDAATLVAAGNPAS